MYAIVKEYQYSHQEGTNTVVIGCCNDLPAAYEAIKEWDYTEPTEDYVTSRMATNVVAATEWETDMFMNCSERWYIAKVLEYK